MARQFGQFTESSLESKVAAIVASSPDGVQK
jgi:hypothetical protein